MCPWCLSSQLHTTMAIHEVHSLSLHISNIITLRDTEMSGAYDGMGIPIYNKYST